MPLQLMYITNNPAIAKIAEDSGVDWIFVDLEILGKKERQGHLDTVISCHSIEDVSKIKDALQTAQLLVRVNPINAASAMEISAVIDRGADIVMLPYFRSPNEVVQFIDFVGSRAKVCLLLETKEAASRIEDYLAIPGIDYIHIGLNDLHLDLKKTFMFELLIDGTVERLVDKISSTEIPFGFGGIARIGQGILPAENIIIEHYKYNSSMAILSRSFVSKDEINNVPDLPEYFKREVRNIRDFEAKVLSFSDVDFHNNYLKIQEIIANIVKDLV